MERLRILRARLDAVEQLRDVVGAMRSMAAMRRQQAAEALPAARRYAGIVAAALSQALTLDGRPAAPRPQPGEAVAVLLFTAEHGFVGGFAEALAAAVAAAPPRLLFAAGSRGAQVAAEAGLAVVWSHAMTTHVEGVPDVARHIAAQLYHRFAAGAFTRLDMVFGRLEDGGRWRVARETLLPLDLRRFAAPTPLLPPLHALPAADLLARLVEEYFLADLVRGATESLAAENAARFQAMSAAHGTMERRIEQMAAEERQLRQEEITEELLDVTAGAELLLGTMPAAGRSGQSA